MPKLPLSKIVCCQCSYKMQTLQNFRNRSLKEMLKSRCLGDYYTIAQWLEHRWPITKVEVEVERERECVCVSETCCICDAIHVPVQCCYK